MVETQNCLINPVVPGSHRLNYDLFAKLLSHNAHVVNEHHGKSYLLTNTMTLLKYGPQPQHQRLQLQVRDGGASSIVVLSRLVSTSKRLTTSVGQSNCQLPTPPEGCHQAANGLRQ